MRTLSALGLAALAAFALAGCGKSNADEKPLAPPPTVNNNAPEAKNAQAAPPITDTPTPGEMMQKGKRRNLNATAPPAGGGAGAPMPGANN